MDDATRVRKEHLELRVQEAGRDHGRAVEMMNDVYAEYWSIRRYKALSDANVHRKEAALAEARAALDAFCTHD